jgi:serine/threonine protein kinase
VDIFAESHFDTIPRSFAPEGSLQSVITQRDMIVELEGINLESPKDADLVESTYLHGIKLFATAVSIGLTGKHLLELMRAFAERGLTDSKLPLRRGSITQERPIDRKVWSPAIERRFLIAQWDFLAPVFSKAHCSLDPECIVPITHKGEPQQSTFSVVYKATIHESHFIQPVGHSAKPQVVALKQVMPVRDSGGEDDFAAERELLVKLREFEHPHIISLVSSFTRGSDNFLIFEWADGGDLVDLWRKQKLSLDNQLVIDTLAQFRGLASALTRVHDANIRHGDIKPNNILRIDDGSAIGCLKLGDWGLAVNHKDTTEMRKRSTATQFGTMLYEAPEAQALEAQSSRAHFRARSRLYDIWSLGCVLLEHIVWLLYGDEERYRFIQDLRDNKSHWSFYQITDETPRKARVHFQVVRWMEHIAEDERCRNTCIQDLLNVIKDKMLVIEVQASTAQEEPHSASEIEAPGLWSPKSAPVPQFNIVAPTIPARTPEASRTVGRSRAHAKEIVEDLDSVLDRAIQDPGYIIKKSSQKVFRGPEKRALATAIEAPVIEAPAGMGTRVTYSGYRIGRTSKYEASEPLEKAAASTQEAAAPQETAVPQQPVDSTQQPGDSTQKPDGSTQHPDDSLQQPSDSTQQPSASASAQQSTPALEGTARIHSVFMSGGRRGRRPFERYDETPPWLTTYRGVRTPLVESRSRISSMSSISSSQR